MCMLKEYQIDPVRREIVHTDFYRIDPEQYITISVPVATTGRAKGVKAGGRLVIVTRTVQVRCKVKDIPHSASYDVTDVAIAESVYIDQLTPPEGCEFIYKNRFPVIRVARKRGLLLEEEEGEGEETTLVGAEVEEEGAPGAVA